MKMAAIVNDVLEVSFMFQTGLDSTLMFAISMDSFFNGYIQEENVQSNEGTTPGSQHIVIENVRNRYIEHLFIVYNAKVIRNTWVNYVFNLNYPVHLLFE